MTQVGDNNITSANLPEILNAMRRDIDNLYKIAEAKGPQQDIRYETTWGQTGGILIQASPYITVPINCQLVDISVCFTQANITGTISVNVLRNGVTLTTLAIPSGQTMFHFTIPEGNYFEQDQHSFGYSVTAIGGGTAQNMTLQARFR